MSWLDQHIEEFVKPHLQNCESVYPNGMSQWDMFDKGHGREPLRYFAPEELTVIKNTWRSIKKAAKGKQILLPGRDVFIFEILARREGYPTVFMPECSRMTVNHIAKQESFERMRRACYLFDTGFAGSIPKALAMPKNKYALMSYHDMNDNVGIQTFPRLSLSRGLALKIERTPKYWESGRLYKAYTSAAANTYFNWYATTDATVSSVDNTATTTVSPEKPIDGILQPFSNPQEFIQAARLTIEIWRNNAPKFINRHKPVACIG